MAHQHPAPPSKAIQTVSAWPVADTTRASARTAPQHSGNSRMATMVFAHFGIVRASLAEDPAASRAKNPEKGAPALAVRDDKRIRGSVPRRQKIVWYRRIIW